MIEVVELPEWSGGSCHNVRCGGSNKQRILSVEEVERVYPVKDKFWWWPLPPGAEYVCTICGFCYSGVREDWKEQQREVGPLQHTIDLSRWDWDEASQFDGTVREAVEDFVRGAPDDAESDEIALGVGRYVSGASPDFARNVMADLDDFDKPAITPDQFM